MVAAVLEAAMSREQARELAELMREGRASRPAGVVTASLLYEQGVARLVAYWRDRDTLDRYLSTTAVPRGVELMRRVGVDPALRVVDVLELG
jgi:hypothetical protein